MIRNKRNFKQRKVKFRLNSDPFLSDSSSLRRSEYSLAPSRAKHKMKSRDHERVVRRNPRLILRTQSILLNKDRWKKTIRIAMMLCLRAQISFDDFASAFASRARKVTFAQQ